MVPGDGFAHKNTGRNRIVNTIGVIFHLGELGKQEGPRVVGWTGSGNQHVVEKYPDRRSTITVTG